jgi:hypothetical protein
VIGVVHDHPAAALTERWAADDRVERVRPDPQTRDDSESTGTLCLQEFSDEFWVDVSAGHNPIQLLLIMRSDLRILRFQQVGMQFDCARGGREQ